MSRFFDMISKPAREMGIVGLPVPRRGTSEQRSRVIKLDSNESPFGSSPRALEAMRSALNSSNLYPDDDCPPLRLRLADHHGLPPDQVLVTAGSTALLSLLCQT